MPGPPDKPPASSEAARIRLSRQATRDTKPELMLRRELHRRGLRYRVNRRPIAQVRRTADVVFTKAKVAVFVDGCFWHRCPVHGAIPKTNTQWWTAKFEANVQRDRDTDQVLESNGWTVIRVWEHADVHEAADQIEGSVRLDRPRNRG